MTSGIVYEMGLPHTRSDIIFMTPGELNGRNLAKLLVHEKIHVYQRVYKRRFQNALKTNGYEIVGMRKERKDLHSNPDLDEYIWSKDDEIYDQKGSKEHPNEEIADILQKK